MEGQLVFHDAPLTQEWENLAYERENGTWLNLAEFFETEHRTNVSISRRRGVAVEQRLFSSEVAARGLEFHAKVSGDVEGVLPPLDIGGVRVPSEIVLLIAAARAVTHIGGSKSRGLGRCAIHAHKIKVDGKELSEDKVLSALTAEVIKGWKNALAHQDSN
jgi:CRISPR/Cas system CSM-associated protein Csm3 (group 7 of RAMP superfamily)